tara:strand:+ start:1079 stop:1366 length:288 start_codon:yes stop_codon:yes gene_type:complete
MDSYSPGNLVYVAGEMLVSRDSYRGNWEVIMFAEGQLGLIVGKGPDSLLVWFAEFGINKKEEHIFACAPLHKQTTKIWSATSALTSPGAEEFLSY